MKAAVVTGAASGIGRALSLQLAAAGHQVHLADVAPTDALAEEIGGVPHQLDVSDASQVERLAAATGPAEVGRGTPRSSGASVPTPHVCWIGS